MTWQQLTERDCRELKMSDIDPHDRHTWRSGMRSALHTSQLPGRGPTDVDVPLYCTLIKNPMMMMKSNMTGKDGKDVALHNIAFLTSLQVLNQVQDELNVLSLGHQIFD